MANEARSGDFLAGLFVGALVGAAAALLLAPQSGEETRTYIREKGIELREQADEITAEARKRAEEFQAQARDKAAELQTRVQEAVEEGRTAASSKKEELLITIEEPAANDEAQA
jgi:gas vesicle protein